MANGRVLFGAKRSKKAPRAALDAAEIARVAYELYQQRGCVDGHDFEDWLKAEAMVRQQQVRIGAGIV